MDTHRVCRRAVHVDTAETYWERLIDGETDPDCVDGETDMETSPIFETVTRPLILEAKQVFTHMVGDLVQQDAAMAKIERLQQKNAFQTFSNMAGREEQFNFI